MCSIQHSVHTVITECVGMACTVGCPVHAADVAIVMAAVTQGLGKLTAGDPCQPTADVIGICQLVGAAAMQLLGSHTSFVVVSIACKGYGTAIVQLVGYTADTVAMVICVGKMTSCSSRHRYTETP